MYVCLCKGVTDKQIRSAAMSGVSSMRQLNQCLGVAGQCGKCGKLAKEILRDAQTEGSAGDMVMFQAVG